MSEKPIMRREFIAGAAVVAGMAATRVDAAHHDERSGQDDLVGAANDCVAAGNACTAHCLAEFSEGRTGLAACAARVEELVASCGALAKLAAQGSEHLPAFAAVAAAICESCEKECRRHAEMHDACRRCAEACVTCKKHCERAAKQRG